MNYTEYSKVSGVTMECLSFIRSHVENGGSMIIYGPAGSGKSTLMEVILSEVSAAKWIGADKAESDRIADTYSTICSSEQPKVFFLDDVIAAPNIRAIENGPRKLVETLLANKQAVASMHGSKMIPERIVEAAELYGDGYKSALSALTSNVLYIRMDEGRIKEAEVLNTRYLI